jgi:hypothetical protein
MDRMEVVRFPMQLFEELVDEGIPSSTSLVIHIPL